MNRRGGRWTVEKHRGTALDLHALEPPSVPGRVVRQLEVTAAALVLGSTQSEAIADLAVLDTANVGLVRRRSGGGAVLLEPNEHLWIDVYVPAGDDLWDDDVGRAAHWLGDVWADVIAAHVGTAAVVHRQGLHADRWGRLVCFAGRGPGEVLVADRKLVGMSQRRTRDWIRLQSMVPLGAEHSEAIVDLLAIDDDSGSELRAALRTRAGAVAAGADVVSVAFVDAICS